MADSITRQLQDTICEKINEDTRISALGLVALAEDRLDIDFEIKQAMAKQGMCIVVMAQDATYQGWTGTSQVWTFESIVVQVVEAPPVWRAQLKKLGKQDGVASDVLMWIAEILGGPQQTTFGKLTPKRIQLGADGTVLVGKATFGGTFYQTLDNNEETQEG